MMLNNPLRHRALTTMLLLCWTVTAAESQSPAITAEVAASTPESDSSPCVLLQNGNVLFGHAHQVGEFVVVRTGNTGEIRLPRSAVACWAASIRDLYQYRKDHRLSADIATHIRDARWCLRYDLFDLAAQEIRAIRKVDPANREAQRIEDQLRRLTSARVAPSASTSHSLELQPVVFQENETRQKEVEPVALRFFARHIQPMLLSKCGRCHDASNRTEGWNLVIPTVGTRASARMTRENLLSSTQYIDASAAAQSELFLKATNPHGGSADMLSSRNAKAIESLARWIAVTAASVQQSGGNQPEPSAGGSSRPLTDQASSTVESKPEFNRDGEDGPPARLPQVSNPFDPEIFNRRFHLDSSDAK